MVMRGLRLRLAVGFALALGGCVVYEPVPVVPQPTVQQSFDRSWAAAAGALADQGVTITAQDRGARSATAAATGGGANRMSYVIATTPT